MHKFTAASMVNRRSGRGVPELAWSPAGAWYVIDPGRFPAEIVRMASVGVAGCGVWAELAAVTPMMGGSRPRRLARSACSFILVLLVIAADLVGASETGPGSIVDLCDPNLFPLTPCTPESDSNAPTCNVANCVSNLGGGSAFMEMQFYPPGEPPFVDSTSCDDTHWCAALTIDSLECTAGFVNCNTNCEEPVNFAFIQRDGVPTGPPSPQDADVTTETPNKETLLMNPGDKITFHMFDAPAPGGGDAFEVVMDDLTTHQSGFMQASAANGFQNTSISRLLGHAVQLPAGVQHGQGQQHQRLDRAPGRHQHRVRDRALGGLHLAQRPDRQPARPERRQPAVQRVPRPVRERRPAGRHHGRDR